MYSSLGTDMVTYKMSSGDNSPLHYLTLFISFNPFNLYQFVSLQCLLFSNPSMIDIFSESSFCPLYPRSLHSVFYELHSFFLAYRWPNLRRNLAFLYLITTCSLMFTDLKVNRSVFRSSLGSQALERCSSLSEIGIELSIYLI